MEFDHERVNYLINLSFYALAYVLIASRPSNYLTSVRSVCIREVVLWASSVFYWNGRHKRWTKTGNPEKPGLSYPIKDSSSRVNLSI